MDATIGRRLDGGAGCGSARGGTVARPRRPVFTRPALDVLPVPHLAHGEFRSRRREVGPGDDLLHALSTDAAEQHTDLGRAHQVVHAEKHSQHATRHLTRGQSLGKASHVTSDVVYGWWDAPTVRLPCVRPRRRPKVHPTTLARIRLAVYERAGYRCQRCGLQFEAKPGYDGRYALAVQIPHRRLQYVYYCLELDHVVPYSRGGKFELSNLQALCTGCNARKGAKV